MYLQNAGAGPETSNTRPLPAWLADAYSSLPENNPLRKLVEPSLSSSSDSSNTALELEPNIDTSPTVVHDHNNNMQMLPASPILAPTQYPGFQSSSPIVSTAAVLPYPSHNPNKQWPFSSSHNSAMPTPSPAPASPTPHDVQRSFTFSDDYSYDPPPRPISPPSEDQHFLPARIPGLLNTQLDSQLLSDPDSVYSEYADSQIRALGLRSPNSFDVPTLQNPFSATLLDLHQLEEESPPVGVGSDPIADALSAEQIFVHPGLSLQPRINIEEATTGPALGPALGSGLNSSMDFFTRAGAYGDAEDTFLAREISTLFSSNPNITHDRHPISVNPIQQPGSITPAPPALVPALALPASNSIPIPALFNSNKPTDEFFRSQNRLGWLNLKPKKKDIYADKLLEHASNATGLPPIPSLNLALLSNSRGRTRLQYEGPWVPDSNGGLNSSNGIDSGAMRAKGDDGDRVVSMPVEGDSEMEMLIGSGSGSGSGDGTAVEVAGVEMEESEEISNTDHIVPGKNRFVTPMPVPIPLQTQVDIPQDQESFFVRRSRSSSSLDDQIAIATAPLGQPNEHKTPIHFQWDVYSAQPSTHGRRPPDSSSSEVFDQPRGYTGWMELDLDPDFDLDLDDGFDIPRPRDRSTSSVASESSHPATLRNINVIGHLPTRKFSDYSNDVGIYGTGNGAIEMNTDMDGELYDKDHDKDEDEEFDELVNDEGRAVGNSLHYRGLNEGGTWSGDNAMVVDSKAREQVHYRNPSQSVGHLVQDSLRHQSSAFDQRTTRLTNINFSRRLVDSPANDVNGTSSPPIRFLTPVPPSPPTSSAKALESNPGHIKTPAAPSPATSHDSIESWSNDDVLAYLKGEFEGKKKKQKG